MVPSNANLSENAFSWLELSGVGHYAAVRVKPCPHLASRANVFMGVRQRPFSERRSIVGEAREVDA